MQRFVNSFLKRGWVELALAAVLLSAAALRLYNVNWDNLQHVHPDERWISMVASDIAWPENFKDILDPRMSTLNPLWIPRDHTARNYAYGHLPLYLLVLMANLVTRFAPLARHLSAYPDLAKAVGDLALMSGYSHINLVGRVVSALADLGIIYLVFLLGKHIYDKRVGLLAATFVAFTVMNIQLSHFCTFDVVTTFFAVLTVYGAVRLAQQGDSFHAAMAGGAAGLAVASKFSAMPIFLTLVVACGVRVLRGTKPGWIPLLVADDQQPEAQDQGLADSLGRALGLLLISLLAAAVAFALTSPFAILDLKAYLNQVKQQGDMVRGVNDWPFTRQYRGTLPYIYHIEQQLRWGMGWPLGLVAFAGLAYILWRAIRRRCRGEEWVILSWVVPYFLITGSFVVKFMRYMLPITPFLSLMGAEMLLTIFKARGTRQNARGDKMHKARRTIPCILVVVSSILYSLAFISIYSRPHTWLEASRWIYTHVPDGSTIATEHWDDDLPKPLPQAGQNSGAHNYHHLTLPMYEADTLDKYLLIKDILSQTDYVILASNRLYRSIPRLPRRYPISTRYYELLFAEKLGFRLEKAFTSYPSLLGWTIVDDKADESFTVYDHPKPLVFKKEQKLSDEELDALFAEALSVESEWELKPGLLSRIPRLLPRLKTKPASESGEEEGKSKTLLLDRPVDELPIVDDFRWNRVASRHHLLAMVVWWIAIELLGLIAWPLAFTVFSNLRDRGYILAKSLGLLFVAYMTWLAASLHLLANSLLTILLTLFLLLALSLFLFFRNKAQVMAFCRSQFRLIVINELLFALAFLIFVGIRLLNPDLWQPWTGGEKMMEFAFLNAILKSPYFPPYDPYFAGGYINYYYYGQFVVTIMVKLTGIEPSVAFNLAVPTLFALTVGGAFCIVYNLTKEDEIRDSRFADRRPIYWGFLGALFVAVLGNLDGLAQIVKKIGDLGGSNFHSTIPGLEGLVRLMPGLVKVFSGQPLPAFDYWAPTRVIPFTINEFPYFSFLFADLHPHMIGIPFTILFLALAFNVVAGFGLSAPHQPKPRPEQDQGLGTKAQPQVSRWESVEKLLGWAVIPLGLGALAVINTWDFPTYLGIISCAFLLRQWKENRIHPLQVVGFAFLTGGLSLVLYWPFFKYYKALHVGIGLVKGRTDFRAFITIWGFFLFVIITFLLTELLQHRSRSGFLRFLRLVAKRWETLPHLDDLYKVLVHKQTRSYLFGVYALGVMLVGIVGLALFRYWVLALLIPPLVLAALLLLYREASPEKLFTYFLIFTGFLVLAGCELLYLKDFLQGGDHRRMNTLFKFYTQVWVLFGLAAAAALPWLWASLRRWRSGRRRHVWMGLFFVLLFSACVYPLLGTPQRVADRFPGERPPIGTLDGMAYMTVGSYAWPDDGNRIELKYDYEAIQWLLANVKGTPVIAEAALPYYREGGSRVASYTGLPSLLGAQHAGEQRYGWQVGQRDGEVRDFYTTGDIERALELVRKLDVSYIYVGKLERTVYDPIGLAKFDRMVEEGYLTVPYSNKEVKIYRIVD